MNIDVLARLRTAAEFALESSFFENRSHRPGGEESLLLNAIKLGDIAPDQVLRHITVAIYTLVTAGDDAMKVGGKDCVLQLVQDPGLQDELKADLARKARARASSAPSYGFRRSLRWRSLR